MRWAISTGTESRHSSAWPRFFPTRYEIPTILSFLNIRKWYCSDSKSNRRKTFQRSVHVRSDGGA